jgi:hypothetical protein
MSLIDKRGKHGGKAISIKTSTKNLSIQNYVHRLELLEELNEVQHIERD